MMFLKRVSKNTRVFLFEFSGGRTWRADFDAICGASALGGCLGEDLEDRFCRYLRCFRFPGLSWRRLGRQILSLLVELPLSGAVLANARKTDFVAICSASTFLGCLGEDLEDRFCRYL